MEKTSRISMEKNYEFLKSKMKVLNKHSDNIERTILLKSLSILNL